MQERALQITYQDNTSTFQELLNKDNSVSIHHKNLQVIAFIFDSNITKRTKERSIKILSNGPIYN